MATAISPRAGRSDRPSDITPSVVPPPEACADQCARLLSKPSNMDCPTSCVHAVRLSPRRLLSLSRRRSASSRMNAAKAVGAGKRGVQGQGPEAGGSAEQGAQRRRRAEGGLGPPRTGWPISNARKAMRRRAPACRPFPDAGRAGGWYRAPSHAHGSFLRGTPTWGLGSPPAPEGHPLHGDIDGRHSACRTNGMETTCHESNNST